MADGQGCVCFAMSEYECCCDVDWTPQELINTRERITQLEGAIKAALANLHFVKEEYEIRTIVSILENVLESEVSDE